jgi:hypothetical protein
MAAGFDEFTPDELRRMQASARRRLQRAGVVEIAFGPARSDGKLATDRPFAVCVFVRRKHDPASPAARIPASMTFRLQRRGQSRAWELPTDVVESPEMQPTGRPLRRTDTPDRATAGAVLSWKRPHRSRRLWGVVSVSHYFAGYQPGRPVKIWFDGSSFLTGSLQFRSPPASGLDTALIECERGELVEGGLIPDNSIPQLDPLTIEELIRLVGKPGLCIPPPGDESLEVEYEYFFPVNDETRALWPMHNVVRVRALSGEPAFTPGRSGTALLTRSRQMTSVQYAGTAPDGMRGLAQAFRPMMEWIEGELDQRRDIVLGSLRLVSTF